MNNEKAFTEEFKTLENALREALNAARLPVVVKLLEVREAESALNDMLNRIMTEEGGANVYNSGDTADRGAGGEPGNEL